MAAAVAAAVEGAEVMLVDDQHRLGGHLRWGSTADQQMLSELNEAVETQPNIEVLSNATVTGRYDDNWCTVLERTPRGMSVERIVKARAKMLVVAPGLIERPYVFEGNDRPGVMLSGAVRRLINLHAVRPGDRAVVFSANSSGQAAAQDLEQAGVEVAALVDATKGQSILSTTGGKHVKSVKLSDGFEVEADLLVTATGWTAPTSLLNMAGDQPVYDTSAARFFPDAPPDNVLVTGGLAGDGNRHELLAHAVSTGKLAARRALQVRRTWQAMTPRAAVAADDGREETAATDTPTPDASAPDMREPLSRAHHPQLFRSATHGMVDFSEDVSSKDLFAAAQEGYDSVELLKRYTTATMGPEQGKLETVNTVAVLAEARGETIQEVGTTVWRPPYAPVSLGALAGRIHEPQRVSPMHRWHVVHRAKPLLAGQWIRPEHYGNPLEEVTNTRSNVGVIDVTPLGKMFLSGRDVPKLLEQVYINKWRLLEVGAVRYGVMVGEDGVVMDDGVTARLSEDQYLMTTTTSGAGGVYEWLEMWLQTEHPDWEVFVDPVTAAFASINVAGPNSRELMSRLVGSSTDPTHINVAPDAFQYMQVRRGTVAGIGDCVVWRIGFTGELSYEIHVPSGFGQHVWDQLIEVGQDLGIAPFGVEAQRIMRLEKGHFIVGQDTDGLSQLPVTGLNALAKLDKSDSAGMPELRWSLAEAARVDTVGFKLVSLTPDDPTCVPDEGCQIVTAGTNDIVGRITSSRFSPTLDRSICMGQLVAASTAPQTVVTVVLSNGKRTTATVMPQHAFYDAEGVKVRG